MPRPHTHFLCRSCGGVQSRWMGRCPECGTWDALEKYVEPRGGSGTRDAGGAAGAAREATQARPLTEIEATTTARTASGHGELDRVLGGGLVAGSVILLGGDPGIGKSTLMLQVAGRVALAGQRVLYVSSEESAYQTKLRAERVLGVTGAEPGLERLLILSDTNLARIIEQARQVKPVLLVIDSIQMIDHGRLDAAPGSVSQLRHCCAELVHLAKGSDIAVALVGHVTKEGQLAGPKVIEHMVDAVLSFEGDRHHAHRVVRARKNRFGTTLEVGLFEMTGSGLSEVDRLGACLGATEPPKPGAVVFPLVQGSRAALVEIQALTATGVLGAARRKSTGLDPSRLAVLIAVLEKHAGLRLADQDVFASTVGGWRVTEPAADLAMCLAIAGAHLRSALPAGLAVAGEIGLGGDVRAVGHMEARGLEAARLSYRTMLVAASQGPVPRGCETRGVKSVAEAIEYLQPVTAPRKRQMGRPAVDNS